jgi:hypothetical protein
MSWSHTGGDRRRPSPAVAMSGDSPPHNWARILEVANNEQYKYAKLILVLNALYSRSYRKIRKSEIFFL